jgi:predicted RNA-binding protein (virulence factor B family)
LDRQEDAIKKKEKEDKQLLLGLDKDELRQLESDRSYWVDRLGQLRLEKKSEPERIRQSYEVKVSQLQPLGVVYLWPRTG